MKANNRSFRYENLEDIPRARTNKYDEELRTSKNLMSLGEWSVPGMSDFAMAALLIRIEDA